MKITNEAVFSEHSYPPLGPCWLAAPAERSPLFFPAFSAISVAIQKALRERLPAAYLMNSDIFQDTRLVYPVLVYQASRPFHGKGRVDLTYDVLDEQMMKRFYRRVKQELATVLSTIVVRLQSEGGEALVRLYNPNSAAEIITAVQKTRKSRIVLYDLLVGECTLINELRQLAGFGNLKPREQAKKSAMLFKAWNSHLRRLCPGRDFRCLGPELLDIASAALIQAMSTAGAPGDAGDN